MAVGAPAVFAASPSVAAATPGSFPQGSLEQSSFTSGATYTFTEGSLNGWTDANCTGNVNGGFKLNINITTANVQFDTATAPTISGPGTLSLTGSFLSSTSYQVVAGSSDKAIQEAFSVSGLKVAAAVTAVVGAVTMTYDYYPATNCTGGYAGASSALFGLAYSIVASGTLAAAHGITTPITGSVINTAGTFSSSAAGLSIVIDAGAVNEETLTAWTAGALSGGTQTLTATTPANYVFGHLINAPVEERQVIAAGFGLASIGNVVVAAALSALKTGVLPGENDQAFGKTSVCENTGKDFALHATVTITIQTVGALFSATPTAGVTGSGAGTSLTLTNSTSTLSSDRKSATFSVSAIDTATTRLSCINISGMYDIASSVTAGTNIKVAVTVGALVSVPATVTNAVAGSNIFGTALSVPTVFIGQNDQPTGTMKITESAVGTWLASAGASQLEICIEVGNGTTPTYTRAPFAVVAPGTDLTILDPATLAGSTTVIGRADGTQCYYWNIFAKSTTAPATIYIVGSDASGAALPYTGLANGPRISLASTAAPGPISFDLRDGNNLVFLSFGNLVDATAAYQNSPTVTALSSPVLTPGGINEPGGNVQIAETASGQLNADELIMISVLPNSMTQRQEHFFTGGSGGIFTTSLAVTSNSNSGLFAHISAVTNTSVTICVDQRAFQPTLGVLTVTGFNYTTVADPTKGPVLLEVAAVDVSQIDSSCNSIAWGQIGPSAPRLIDAFVSNAHVGALPTVSGSAGSAKGITHTGPFTAATKVSKHGAYFTYQFNMGVAQAGKLIRIWSTTKSGASWGTWTVVTSRLADASGSVYYMVRSKTAAWKSYRAFSTDMTISTSGHQVRWL
jgi:hypothetical protein